MSLSRSTSTGLCVFCTGSSFSPGAFLPAGNRLQRRRQRRAFDARLGGQAVDELLADQRLRAIVQLASARKSWKPGLFDVQHDRRLAPAAWA